LFLHNVMRLSLRASGSAIKAQRALTEPEQRALLDGFRASAMAMDITKHEERRERLGLSQFFPPQLVHNLVLAASLLAKDTALLEKRRDRFVLEFQLRLAERIEKRLQPKDRDAADAADEADEDATKANDNPRFAFTGDPSPDHGFKALALLNGRYNAIKEALQEAAAEEAAAIQALKEQADAEAAAEADAAHEPAEESIYNQYYTPEKAAAMQAEFLAARSLQERQEIIDRQARAMFIDYKMNPPENQTGPPE
jgi:hypothetical protein